MLAGIEDMEKAIDVLVDAKPDAIQLSVGQADLLQRHPGRDKPALVLRTDTPNIYAAEAPEDAWSFVIDDPVGHAVRLDAACVVINLLDVPGQDGLRRDCLEGISQLRAECDRVGMPLMVEPLAFERGGGGGYQSSGDVDRIMGLVRQAVELGADIIKADPTDDLSEYHRVTTVARVPLLAARRRPRQRQGDPRAHPDRARAGRGRDRLRPQRDPAREPRGDDRGAHVGGARRRVARRRRARATLQVSVARHRHRRRRPDGPRAGGGDRALGGAGGPPGHAAAGGDLRHQRRGARVVRARRQRPPLDGRLPPPARGPRPRRPLPRGPAPPARAALPRHDRRRQGLPGREAVRHRPRRRPPHRRGDRGEPTSSPAAPARCPTSRAPCSRTTPSAAARWAS